MNRTRDRGAALIIAIGFVTMIGAMTAGMTALVTSSTNNRVSLTTIRNQQYAADAAVEDAIAAVRSLDRASAGSCSSALTSSTTTLNSIKIRVDSLNACLAIKGLDGIPVAQRNVIFTACLDTGATCSSTKVIIRAQVNFQQAISGVVAKTFVQSWSVDQ
jgi:hypothetical protein